MEGGESPSLPLPRGGGVPSTHCVSPGWWHVGKVCLASLVARPGLRNVGHLPGASALLFLFRSLVALCVGCCHYSHRSPQLPLLIMGQVRGRLKVSAAPTSG